MKTLKIPSLTLIVLGATSACVFDDNDFEPVAQVTEGPTLTMDPNELTPLAGVVDLTTNVPVGVSLTISDGRDAWEVEFPDFATEHSLPVLGLKPNGSYTVGVWITSQSGRRQTLGVSLPAVTGPLPPEFPVIETLVSMPDRMEPGYTLLDRFFRNRDEDPSLQTYSMIVDSSGEVVWYGELGGGSMQQLPNGNLWFRRNASVVEQDLLGNIVSLLFLEFPEDKLHHDLQRTTDGTYISLSIETVIVEGFPTSTTDPDAPTQTAEIRDEPFVEFAADGSFLRTCSLVDMLDEHRISYTSLRETDDGLDWAHTNAVVHDPSDDSIILSARGQDAVIKFSRSDCSLIWILGNHNNWAPEFEPFLLTPPDDGTLFEWQYGEHAPMITPVGTLLLFDNGNSRASPFDGTPRVRDIDNYSRAVEYEIDSMDVRQVWEYGSPASQATPRLFSTFISDADRLPNGNTLIDFGGNNFTDGVTNNDLGFGENVTRIVEVDHATPADKVFDMRLYNPMADARIAVYRAERIPSLYAAGVTVEVLSGQP